MPTTWFVNLPLDAGHNRGPHIPLTVSRGRLTRYQGNRSVTWTCTPADTNFNTVAADASFSRGDHPNTQRSSTAETHATRNFHNRLQLPPYGGDSYTVTARRSDKTGNSLNHRFDIKRRIYYIFNYMNDEGLALYNALRRDLERIFADVGIELKRVSRQQIPNRAIVSDLRPLVANRPAIPNGKRGLILRLGLVNLFAKAKSHQVELPLVNGHGAGGQGDRVVKQDGAWKLTVKLPPQLNVADHRKLRLPAEASAKVRLAHERQYSHAVRSRWLTDCRRLPHSIRRVDDTTAEITISGRDNAALDSLIREHTAHYADNPLHQRIFARNPNSPQVRLDVDLVTLQPLGGFSRGANISLTQDMSMYYPHGTRQQKAPALARVFAHEIAHSIGMVAASMTYNGGNHNHSRHYTNNNGGTGSHCHKSATLVNNTALAAGDFYNPTNPNCNQVYTPDDGTACIMFHQRSAHLHQMEFCAECKDFMRAQTLTRTKLIATKGWDQVY